MRKVIEFFKENRFVTIFGIAAGSVIAIIVFFWLTEYTFSFVERLLNYYAKAGLVFLVILWIIVARLGAKEDDTEKANAVVAKTKDSESSGSLEAITYHAISEVLFYTFQECANEYCVVIPRSFDDVQDKNNCFFIEKSDVKFYQCPCDKSDPGHRYTDDELKDIKGRLQHKIDKRIRTARFPSVSVDSHFIVESVYDNGYELLFQMVVPDENYYRYKQRIDSMAKTYGRLQDGKDSANWGDDT